eukprot:Tbor_TRINITY_DN5895_c0_g1::TRINITY_DN5895_c0_g1_i16::g.7106::m.7106
MGTGCVVSNVSIILLISIRYGKKTYSSHASGLTWTMVLSLRAQAKTVWNSNSFFPIIAEAYRHTPRIVATCLVVRVAVRRMSFSVFNFPRVFEDRVFEERDLLGIYQLMWSSCIYHITSGASFDIVARILMYSEIVVMKLISVISEDGGSILTEFRKGGIT